MEKAKKDLEEAKKELDEARKEPKIVQHCYPAPGKQRSNVADGQQLICNFDNGKSRQALLKFVED